MKELIGKNVIIRTVTYHYIGHLESIGDGWMHLSDAAWLADSGRWSKALETGNVKEVELYGGPCHINASAVVDVSEWRHELPKETK